MLQQNNVVQSYHDAMCKVLHCALHIEALIICPGIGLPRYRPNACQQPLNLELAIAQLLGANVRTLRQLLFMRNLWGWHSCSEVTCGQEQTC